MGPRPSLAEIDELLAYLSTFPGCPEVAEVVDLLLDHRLSLPRQEASMARITICCGCAGARTEEHTKSGRILPGN